MTARKVGIVMHGVTGRMGKNQHLERSIVALRDQGGFELKDGARVVPDPILIGRNRDRVRAVAEQYGVERYGDSLAEALADPYNEIFFDAGTTEMRSGLLQQALEAGKHVYCEKPIAPGLDEASRLAQIAGRSGLKHGVVHDKLYLPGLIKLRRLRDSGFFGRMLSLRVEFGYWVFEGDWQAAQRPSWNYRKQDGGGIILDMFCHWRYVLDNVVAPVKSVCVVGATHIPERVDERGDTYAADADDAAYALVELEGGVVGTLNSSWCVRVRRDDLVTFQVDGTHGSAVAGLTHCVSQQRVNTPKPVWNPDVENPFDFHDHWEEVPANADFENGFKAQWVEFLKHVLEDQPYAYDLYAGAAGVQFAEIAQQSWSERRWVDVPALGS